MTYGSFTPPGFDEDRYFDESDREPLTDEQIAAMNEVWPQYAEYAHLGNLSAVDPPYQVTLQCDACRVRWIGCQDAAECPMCDTDCLSAYQDVARILTAEAEKKAA